jgi:uncharacterized oxidoreductase
MTQSSDNIILVKAPALKTLVGKIFSQAGSNPRESELVADHLVEANLRGHDSHGVGMIPLYITNLGLGEAVLNVHPTVMRDLETMVVLDGGLGLGQSIAHEAMEIGIKRAQKHGSCIVALRNSHHIGRIGHWAEQCADAGLVSLHFVNVVAEPVVAPYGGKVARLVTNPVSIGIPRQEKPPVIVDFATSKLAHGKIRVAYNKGVDVPEGALIDSMGTPTTDPSVLFEDPKGALLPFGDHKGWTLAFACEALAGALTGGLTVKGPAKRPAVINNMLSIIVSADSMGTAPSFFQELEGFVQWAQSAENGQASSVLLPGDPERATRSIRLAEGIPVDKMTWRQITQAAESVGVAERALAAALEA